MLAFTTVLWAIVGLLLFLGVAFLLSCLRDWYFFHSRKVYWSGSVIKNILVAMVWHKKGFVDVFHSQYKILKDAHVTIGGHMAFGTVNYTVIDPELLKHIFIKDFDHFVNRRQIKMPQGDALVSKMLIFLNDDQWKGLRSKMSPTFTTGKIKKMYPLFSASSNKLVSYIEKMMKSSTDGQLDLSEGFSKFTMDTIASIACAVDSEAFDQEEPSLFEKIGKKLQLQFNALQFIQFMLMSMFPKISGFFGMSLFGREASEFFSTAIKSNIAHRQRSGERGNDFIQLMMDAREGHLKVEDHELSTFEKDAQLSVNLAKSDATNLQELMDDDGIVSNCVLFILAGYDTTQSLLIFTAYALALNPEVQDRLRAEVRMTLDENGGQFSYETLHRMEYLEMVINESLRFYPPAVVTNRSCTKDYTFPGTEISIRKGHAVAVPIIAIHHDEKYYPNPEKFDPERFSSENKKNIHPYTYLPFGHGPRNCIGMRFALTEVKLAIAQLVNNFYIQPSSKTSIPMKYQNSGSLKPKDGMWLGFKKIV